MSNKTKTWKEKTPAERQSFVIKLVVLLLFTIGVVVTFVFADKLFGENSVFNKNITSNSVINTLYQKIPALIRSIQIIVIAIIIMLAIRFIMHKLLARSNRGITIVKL